MEIEPVLDDELLGKTEEGDSTTLKKSLGLFSLYTLGYLMLMMTWSWWVRDHRTSWFIEEYIFNWFVMYLCISWLFITLYFVLLFNNALKSMILGSGVFAIVLVLLGILVNILWIHPSSLLPLGTSGAIMVSVATFILYFKRSKNK